jgi:hypothetical protein
MFHGFLFGVGLAVAFLLVNYIAFGISLGRAVNGTLTAVF